MSNLDDLMEEEKSQVEKLAMQIADLASDAGCYLLGEVNDGKGHGCMSFHGMTENVELDMMHGFGDMAVTLFYELQKRGRTKDEARSIILTVIKFAIDGAEEHYKVKDRWGSGI